MRIYRGITLNEGEKINTQNIGRSWSLCEIYAEDHVKNNCPEKRTYVVLAADIDESMIDWPNTLLAHDRRPREFEIVLKKAAEIQAYIHFSKNDDYAQFDPVDGMSGDNVFEDYFFNDEEYGGNLTIGDVIALADSFA